MHSAIPAREMCCLATSKTQTLSLVQPKGMSESIINYYGIQPVNFQELQTHSMVSVVFLTKGRVERISFRDPACTSNGVTEAGCSSSSPPFTLPRSEERWLPIPCWVNREGFWLIPHASCVWPSAPVTRVLTTQPMRLPLYRPVGAFLLNQLEAGLVSLAHCR